MISAKAARTAAGIAEVQLHPADLGLVRDVRAVELQHHREAERRGGLRRRVGRRGPALLHHGHADLGEQRLGLRLGQYAAPPAGSAASAASSPAGFADRAVPRARRGIRSQSRMAFISRRMERNSGSSGEASAAQVPGPSSCSGIQATMIGLPPFSHQGSAICWMRPASSGMVRIDPRDRRCSPYCGSAIIATMQSSKLAGLPADLRRQVAGVARRAEIRDRRRAAPPRVSAEGCGMSTAPAPRHGRPP